MERDRTGRAILVFTFVCIFLSFCAAQCQRHQDGLGEPNRRGVSWRQ